jgi:DNA repair protein RadC
MTLFAPPPARSASLSPATARACAGPPAGRVRAAPTPSSSGAHARTDGELLAVLLGQGRPRGNHFDLARTLLSSAGGLGGLAQSSLPELLAVPGLGPTRATVLAAAMEIGRRSAGRRPERGQRLGDASEVYAHYRARLGSANTEEFWVMGLDVRHRLILEACVARGSLTGVEVHPREVFRPLIRAAAAAVIFCHNHPSGDPTPSRQDFDLTARLKEVGALCGIAVLDHVVVGAEGFVSLAERGWL